MCHGQASCPYFLGWLSLHSEGLISYTHWKESNSWWDDHAPFIPCNLDHRTSKQCSCDNRKWLRTLGCFQFEMWSFSGNGRPLNVHNPAAYKSFQHIFLIPSHWGTQAGLFQYRWWSDFLQDFLTGWEVHLEPTVKKHEQIWDPSTSSTTEGWSATVSHGGPVWNRGRMDTASSSRVDGRLDRKSSASASGGSCFCFAKLGMGGLRWSIYSYINCLILTSILIFLSWICWVDAFWCSPAGNPLWLGNL